MNKETKVGLLVGLSFIVLFGVILSNQAPDIVAPPEKPMLVPAAPRRTQAQVIRQIERSAPAPEPVDLVVDAADEQADTPDVEAVEPRPPVDTGHAADASTDDQPARYDDPERLERRGCDEDDHGGQPWSGDG